MNVVHLLSVGSAHWERIIALAKNGFKFSLFLWLHASAYLLLHVHKHDLLTTFQKSFKDVMIGLAISCHFAQCIEFLVQ